VAGLLAGLLLVDAAGAAELSPVVAIRGARVVGVDSPPLEKGTVVMAGGKILAVGPDAAVPPGATLIDGTGLVVYPGLIDGLTTIGLTEIASVPGSVDVAEVGEVNPQVKAWVAVHPQSELIPVARANGLTAVLAAPGGSLLTGQSALLRLAGSTPDALTLKTPVAMHLTYPTGRPAAEPGRLFEEPELKTFEERQREKKRSQDRALNRLRSWLEEARAYGAALRGARAGTLPSSPRPDPVLEALAPAAGGELPFVVRADDEEDIRGAVRFAEVLGLKLILAGGLEAWRCADLLRQKDVPVLVHVDRLPGRESDPYDAAYANPALLHRAGVRLAIVSDSASFTRNLPYEAAMARAFGLPADVALRAITLAPAEILGVGDRMGSLTPGKDANLFLATGDIMDHRTQVTRVFIEGLEQSLETRHTRLYREFKDRP
jgi:imidazolonepropionase-like amidohydrolase